MNPKKADEKTFTGISGNFCLSTKKNIVNTSPRPLIKREKRKISKANINCKNFLFAPGNTKIWLQKNAKTFAKNQANAVEMTVEKSNTLVNKAYKSVLIKAAITP